MSLAALLVARRDSGRDTHTVRYIPAGREAGVGGPVLGGVGEREGRLELPARAACPAHLCRRGEREREPEAGRSEGGSDGPPLLLLQGFLGRLGGGQQACRESAR